VRVGRAPLDTGSSRLPATDVRKELVHLDADAVSGNTRFGYGTGTPPAPAPWVSTNAPVRGTSRPLAGGLAEAISRANSRYCLEEFGATFHDNTDKTSLLDGVSRAARRRVSLRGRVRVQPSSELRQARPCCLQ
jgi:hypothetical protein